MKYFCMLLAKKCLWGSLFNIFLKYSAHSCRHSLRCLLFPIQFLWRIRLSPFSCFSTLCCLRRHFVSSDALSSHVYIVSLCSLACSVSNFVSCCLVVSSARSWVIYLFLYGCYSPRLSSCLQYFSQSEEFNGDFLLCNWFLNLETLCLSFMFGFNAVFLSDYALLLQFSRKKIFIIVGALKA